MNLFLAIFLAATILTWYTMQIEWVAERNREIAWMKDQHLVISQLSTAPKQVAASRNSCF